MCDLTGGITRAQRLLPESHFVVQLRIAVWTGNARDTRPQPDVARPKAGTVVSSRTERLHTDLISRVSRRTNVVKRDFDLIVYGATGYTGRLIAWISKNLGDERLNVDQLAEHVGMSPRNFARSYKAKTGRTPAKAIAVFRLEAPRRLLEETAQGVDGL